MDTLTTVQLIYFFWGQQPVRRSSTDFCFSGWLLMFGKCEALVTNLHVRPDAHHAISQDLNLSTDWASTYLGEGTFHTRMETSVKVGELASEGGGEGRGGFTEGKFKKKWPLTSVSVHRQLKL